MENSVSHDVQPGDTSRRVSLLIPEGFDYQSCSQGWFLIGLGYALNAVPICILGFVGHVLVIMGLGYLLKIHRGAWIVIILEVLSFMPIIPLVGYYFGFLAAIAAPIGLAFIISLESVILGRPWINTGAWVGAIISSGISVLPFISLLMIRFRTNIMPNSELFYMGYWTICLLAKGCLAAMFIRMSRLLKRLGEVNAVPVNVSSND